MALRYNAHMRDVSGSKYFPDSFHRVAVKGLVEKDGKILLLKESLELGGTWELPGGGLDFGEDLQQGLRREVFEETGLIVTKISDRPTYSWTTRFENKRGMDWYYSLVVAYRMELENFEFKSSKECVEIGFFSKDELEEIKLCPQALGFKKIFNPKDFE